MKANVHWILWRNLVDNLETVISAYKVTCIYKVFRFGTFWGPAFNLDKLDWKMFTYARDGNNTWIHFGCKHSCISREFVLQKCHTLSCLGEFWKSKNNKVHWMIWAHIISYGLVYLWTHNSMYLRNLTIRKIIEIDNYIWSDLQRITFNGLVNLERLRIIKISIT